jgi:hypothetical protein
MSTGMLGRLYKLKVGNGATPETYTAIPQLKDVGGFKVKRKTVPITNRDSTSEEKLVDTVYSIDPITCTVIQKVGDATQEQCLDDILSARTTARNFELTATDGYTYTFAGFVTEFSQEQPEEKEATFSFTIDPTGDAVQTP